MATAPQRNATLPAHVQVNADAVAARVGAAAPVIDKRIGDCRPYVIDLQPVLRAGELVQSIDLVDAPGLDLMASRPYFGTYIELMLGGGSTGEQNKPFEHGVEVLVRTNQGALQVPLIVRVHAR